MFDINRADKEIIMARLELRHYATFTLVAKFLSYSVEVLARERFWFLAQMAFKFFEPRVLLLLKLVVIVVQSLRPLKERPLHFAGIGCACDV